MSGIVNYEVFVYQNNTWDLIGRYPSERRAAAMEHAKSIEFSQQKPTKVVKETYNLEAQTFNESLVYLSELPKPAPKEKYIGGAAPPLMKYKKQQSTGQEQSFPEALIMLGLALVVSLMGAGALAAGILRVMTSANFIPMDLSSNFTLGLFIFFFLFLSIPLAIRWVDWNVLMGADEIEELIGKIPKLMPEEPSEKAYKPVETERIEQPEIAVSGFARVLFDVVDRMMGRKTLAERLEDRKKEEQRKKEEAEKAAEEAEAEKAAKPEIAPPPADEPEEPEEEKTPEPVVLPVPDKKEPVEEGPTILPPELEKYNLRLTALLSLILKVMQKQNTLLNTYARFGIELFLAGACEALCKRKSLTRNDNRVLLSALLELMGRSKALSDLFFDKLDEYMMEPQYLPMIDSGAKATEIFSVNPTSPELISLIQNAMQKWLNPEKKATPQSGIITVMFTDIVGSTQMTQIYGDRLAQQLIHKHNTIVRQALNTCNGEEIKQTGDGIMASFVWASNAIDAAISIQRAVDTYNRQSPTVPLEIRIGLNSGEPIVENNDLFGLTVQMSSRICGHADKNQIFISSVVKELAAGKNYTFNDLGMFELKGITEKQHLYEVVWKKPKTKHKPKEEAEKPTEEDKSFDQLLPEL